MERHVSFLFLFLFRVYLKDVSTPQPFVTDRWSGTKLSHCYAPLSQRFHSPYISKASSFSRSLTLVILYQVLANGPPNKHITRNNAAKSSECQLEDDSPAPNRAPMGTHSEVVGDKDGSTYGGPHVCELKQPASKPWLCKPIH